MDLQACLPGDLRGATITRIAAGLSGAGVYRVETAGRAFVLKVAGEDAPHGEWRRRVRLHELAAAARLAPPIAHVDEAHRAVVSALVVDRGFLPLVFDPRTRDAAIAQLGTTLRRVHELPLPADAAAKDLPAFLAQIWSGLAGFALPEFVGEVVGRVRAAPVPASERALVTSHNDVNPSNLTYDGESLLLLDWDTAGANDPYYDLAAIAVFLRFDDEACAKLVAAHDGAPIAALPARFLYDRRLIAAMCGAMFLQLARQRGHAGGSPTLEETISLADVAQRMRAGTLSPATPDGQWAFGLALVKAGLSFQG